MVKHSRARRAQALIVLALLGVVACAAAEKRERRGDEWAYDGKAHDLSDDPDAAETRWRHEIAARQWTDEQDMLDHDKLLTDDPPGAPSSYGSVASEEPADTGPPVPRTFWQRFQSVADTFGRGSFASLTVAVTLGMMVAPYFLM